MEVEESYSKIRLSCFEYIKYIAIIGVVDAVFSYIFYQSGIVFFLFLMPMYIYLKEIKKRRIVSRKKLLRVQFKEFCLSLSSQLIAGYSIENAMTECYGDMRKIYDENADICRELKYILQRLKMNTNIEQCFDDFGKRSEIEEIVLFADVIKIAKRSGGNMIEIVKNAANSICQKIEVEREIESIVHSKKYEQRVMDVVPLAIIMYINVTTDSMMRVMYETWFGRVVMSICLICYVGAFILGEKITNIEV